jgi:hypothetical protein
VAPPLIGRNIERELSDKILSMDFISAEVDGGGRRTVMRISREYG